MDFGSIMADVNYAEILFTGGGAIGYLLWGISVAMLALVIHFFITIRRVNILPAALHEKIGGLFEGKQYRQAIDLTVQQGDFLSYMIHSSLTEAPHGYAAMERAMEEAAEQRTTQMLRSIEWLNLIGNIGPMLGLLGTVWGMIGAFFTIVESGSPEPAKLAGDIGVALVTTLLGLGVSIPALAGYSILRNRIDAVTSEAVMACQELISTFRPAAKRQ